MPRQQHLVSYAPRLTLDQIRGYLFRHRRWWERAVPHDVFDVDCSGDKTVVVHYATNCFGLRGSFVEKRTLNAKDVYDEMPDANSHALRVSDMFHYFDLTGVLAHPIMTRTSAGIIAVTNHTSYTVTYHAVQDVYDVLPNPPSYPRRDS